MVQFKMKKNNLIMLVEDNPGDIFLLEESFNFKCGNFNFEIAKDGEIALKILSKLYAENRLPNVIILDLNIPKISGIEFLKIKSGIKELKNIPVVLFTTSTYQKEINGCLELGAVKYFNKPMNFEDYDKLVSFICKFIQADKNEFHFI